MKTDSEPPTITLGETEYVIIPRADYERMRSLAGVHVDAVDAVTYAGGSIAKTLKAARKEAGLTQAELAQKLGESQAMVSEAESGKMIVSERYATAVIQACNLPKGWTG